MRMRSARKEKEREKVATTAEEDALQENVRRRKKGKVKVKQWSATHAEATAWQGTATQDGSKAKERGRNSLKGTVGSVASMDATERTAGVARARTKAKEKAKRKAFRPGALSKLQKTKSGARKTKNGRRRMARRRWRGSQWNAGRCVRSQD